MKSTSKTSKLLLLASFLLAATYGISCVKPQCDISSLSLPEDSIENSSSSESRVAAQGDAERTSDAKSGELRVVDAVELDRYMGKWFEIARYDNVFQRGLVGVIAEYTRQEDGTILVRNTGRKKTLNGDISVSTAKGWVVDGSNNAKWEIEFIWPLKAGYYILDLGDDYEYAVVGQPSRSNLWVISRTPQMSNEQYAEICKRLRTQGYDPELLKKTPQPKSAP